MSGAITAGTLATVAGIGAAGSIGSAAIGSHAAGSAASKQMQAAQQAAQLQAQQSQNAINYQNGIYGQTQQNLAPWLQAGGGALNNLSYLLGINPNTGIGGSVPSAKSLDPSSIGIGKTPTSSAALGTPSANSLNSGLTSGMNPSTGAVPAAGAGSNLQLAGGLPGGAPRAGAVAGIQGGGINQNQPAISGGSPSSGGFGSLTSGYGQTFQAPTDITEQNDPGYQARLKLGTDAVQRSAAARGNVLTGGTAKALDQFGQDYASNEYGNVYNRALNTFGTNYGVWNNDQNNIYNRLMGISNSGQQAGNTLGALGQESSNNVTSNLLGTGAQIGQDFNNAGAANASGIVGSGNAWQGALGGTTNNISQLLMLKQLGIGF